MGRAVLLGLLESLHPMGTAGSEESTAPIISRFIATTRTEASAEKLRDALGGHGDRVEVRSGDSQSAIRDADIVVLGFKAHLARGILSQLALSQAMSGKLVISLLAGFDIAQISSLITAGGQYTENGLNAPVVAKAIPNIAARVRQATTILEMPDNKLPADDADLVQWIFAQVGMAMFVPTTQVDPASMLVTNAIAAISVAFEGLLDGAVVDGLRRDDAMKLATQGIVGFGSLLQGGEHPSLMRESIVSPRGCTAQSLLTVEKAATRAVFAQAQIDGVAHMKTVSK